MGTSGNPPGTELLPVLARPPSRQPKAAREQLSVQAWESGLHDLARVHHPSVVWWHGYRQAEERFGSYCYVCEKFIVTWSRAWPIPMVAKEAINDHKLMHRAGRFPAPQRTRKRGTQQ